MTELVLADALPHTAPPEVRAARWSDLAMEVESLLHGEDDWICAMASVVAVLHGSWLSWHWTGFYRANADGDLLVGPYQGGIGCLRIPRGQGVCGVAAARAQTQRVPDVTQFPGHIACAASTASELVVPVVAPSGRVIAVIDVDSDYPDAFDAVDQRGLEALAARLGERFGPAVELTLRSR